MKYVILDIDPRIISSCTIAIYKRLMRKIIILHIWRIKQLTCKRKKGRDITSEKRQSNDFARRLYLFMEKRIFTCSSWPHLFNHFGQENEAGNYIFSLAIPHNFYFMYTHFCMPWRKKRFNHEGHEINSIHGYDILSDV